MRLIVNVGHSRRLARVLRRQRFFEIYAQRVGFVFAKWRPALEAMPLIQTDGFNLVDAGFKSQRIEPTPPGVLAEMIEHRFPKAKSTIRRAHIHSLDLAIFARINLQATTACEIVFVAS